MVTSNRTTVMFFVTVWPWPFDLWVNACRATAIEYTCTKFGVDSSSRFPVTARTNRQMRLNAIPTPAAMPLWLIMIILVSIILFVTAYIISYLSITAHKPYHITIVIRGTDLKYTPRWEKQHSFRLHSKVRQLPPPQVGGGNVLTAICLFVCLFQNSKTQLGLLWIREESIKFRKLWLGKGEHTVADICNRCPLVFVRCLFLHNLNDIIMVHLMAETDSLWVVFHTCPLPKFTTHIHYGKQHTNSLSHNFVSFTDNHWTVYRFISF